MYREDGEVIEVPEDELPIKLPEDVDLSIPGNPLITIRHGNTQNVQRLE